MDDLITFINARLDDEAALIEVMRDGGFPPETWITEAARNPVWTILRDADDPTPIAYIRDSRCEYEHIALHDPARALREIEAKRAHLAAYEGAISGCLEWGIVSTLGDILYSDAAVWSDHPDYRQEWAP